MARVDHSFFFMLKTLLLSRPQGHQDRKVCADKNSCPPNHGKVLSSKTKAARQHGSQATEPGRPAISFAGSICGHLKRRSFLLHSMASLSTVQAAGVKKRFTAWQK
jgi:hypothetical protein